MKQILTSKILRKFLILSCLAMGLAIISSNENVQAAPIGCYEAYVKCNEQCDRNPPFDVPGEPNCYERCNMAYFNCS